MSRIKVKHVKNPTQEEVFTENQWSQHEKFEKCVSKLKLAWGAAQRRKRIAGRPHGVGELREHLLLLFMYYRTYTTHLFLAQIFKVDEATICRAIRRIAPLAERILKIKPERLSDAKRRRPRVTPVDELSLSRIFVA